MSVLYLIVGSLIALSVLLYVLVNVLKSKKQSFEKTKVQVKNVQEMNKKAFEATQDGHQKVAKEKSFIPSSLSAE